MTNDVHNYDLSVLTSSLSQISRAMTLLNVFMQIADKHNQFNVSKRELRLVMGKSYRTISDWISRLAKAEAIKYKYSGAARLNPFFYFNGAAADYNVAISEWEKFKSDIDAVKK